MTAYTGFHNFKRPESDQDYGAFEVFERTPYIPFPGDEEPFEHGFYWRPVFPGYPRRESPSFGPFKSAEEAYNDAKGDL